MERCRADGANPVIDRGRFGIRFYLYCPICGERTGEHIVQSEAVREWDGIQGTIDSAIRADRTA